LLILAAPIALPPLREREGDIGLLIAYFGELFAEGKEFSLSPALADFLQAYRWPGNIRELCNVVRYLCQITAGREATCDDLPLYIKNGERVVAAERHKSANQPALAFGAEDAVIAAAILSIFQQAKVLQKSVGRQSLQRGLARRGIILTAHKVKHWLHVLAELGYTAVGATRQGTSITPAGKLALDYLLTVQSKQTGI
jgi:DNA-binding NtrC family response regulator